MANAMTKNEIVTHIAEKVGITKKDAQAALDTLTELAYKEAKKDAGFTLPGLGKLVKVRRKKRKGRNPATGEEITIPARTDVKFQVSKVAKDRIVPQRKKG